MKSIQSNIKKAKKYLDKNHCIAVPTETVYGLAGNAYSDIAVKRIFKLKKRPPNNPLIVHYYDLNNSVESYQQLLKLNNIIEKKFHKNFRSIGEETNKKVKEIIKKK